MSKRSIIFLSLLLSCCLLSVSATAYEIVGFRGSSWGELKYDIPKEGENNLLWSGWVKQGVDWVQVSDNITLNTYAKLHYNWDKEEQDWNNMIGPSVGISLDAYSPKGVVATMGVEYVWENHFLDSGYTDEKLVVYVNWFGWWDLKK
jgi:hypothetical protein